MDAKDLGIIEELGLTNLTEEQRNELVGNLAEALQNRVAIRVMDLLSESEKEEFDKLAEEGDESKLQNYLKERVPQVDVITAEEYEKLKEELVSQAEAVKKAL